MKLIIFLFVSIFAFSASYANDFQSVSDESLDEARTIAGNIKQYLQNAESANEKKASTKKLIENNPSQYDLSLIQAEWDEVLADLRAGRFCNGCGRSKKQLEAASIDYQEHVNSNGGTHSAPQSTIDATDETYRRKWNAAAAIHETYDKAQTDRSSYIFKAQTLIGALHNSIQLTYDFQLRTYGPIKKMAIEAFKKLALLLSNQNTKVLQTLPEDPHYEDYVYERFTTTEKIDSNLTKLNTQRSKILEAAEKKKEQCLDLISDIQSIARTIGEDDVPSASMVEVSFGYELLRDEYIGVRATERLERLLTAETNALYKKAKEERN